MSHNFFSSSVYSQYYSNKHTNSGNHWDNYRDRDTGRDVDRDRGRYEDRKVSMNRVSTVSSSGDQPSPPRALPPKPPGVPYPYEEESSGESLDSDYAIPKSFGDPPPFLARQKEFSTDSDSRDLEMGYETESEEDGSEGGAPTPILLPPKRGMLAPTRNFEKKPGLAAAGAGAGAGAGEGARANLDGSISPRALQRAPTLSPPSSPRPLPAHIQPPRPFPHHIPYALPPPFSFLADEEAPKVSKAWRQTGEWVLVDENPTHPPPFRENSWKSEISTLLNENYLG
jgi:hypothetical protein